MKNNRLAKFASFIALLISAFFAVFAFSACEHDHEYGDWSVTTPTTCSAEGVRTRTCTICGAEDTLTIDKIKHTAGDWIIDKDATCTEDGEKHQVCAVCGETIGSTNIAALGHTAGDWVTEKEATCTESGSCYQNCTVCGETITTEEVAALGHSYTDNVINKSTLSHICSTCGDSYEETIQPISITIVETGRTTSTISINSYTSVKYGVEFEIQAEGGYGELQYKYEAFASSSSSSPDLVQDFTTDNTFGYQRASAIEGSVLRVTVKDNYGNTATKSYTV